MSNVPSRLRGPTSSPLFGLSARISRSERYPKWLMTVCLVGLCASTFPVTILTVAIVPIAKNLHSQPGTIAWVTTAPMLAGAVATPVVGRLGDLRGHRRLFLIGVAISGTFALLTALAWSAATLITFRTVSQLGASTTIPSTYAMFFRTLPPQRRLRAASLASGVLAGSSVVGLIVGGPMIDLFGWRPIFVIQCALSVLAFGAAFVVLRRDTEPREAVPVDYAGALALAVATLALTFGINRVAVGGLTGPVIAAFVIFPISLAALVVIERRTPHPLLPFNVLRSRNARAVMGASFFTGAGWMGNFITTPLMLQSGLGYSTGVTSLITAPRGTAMFSAYGVASPLANRFGVRRATCGVAFLLPAVILIMAFGTHLRSLPIIEVGLLLTGLLMGIMGAGMVTTISNSVPERDIGVATSLQQTSSSIGSVVGIGLCTAIAANATDLGTFIEVYLISAAILLAGAVVWLFVRDVAPAKPLTVPSELDPGKLDLGAPELGESDLVASDLVASELVDSDRGGDGIGAPAARAR